MLREKSSQKGSHQEACDWRLNDEAQQTRGTVVKSVEFFGSDRQLSQCGPHAREQPLTRFGQRYAACRSVEKPDAQAFLQRTKILAQR